MLFSVAHFIRRVSARHGGALILIAIFTVAAPGAAFAQSTGTIQGTVVAEGDGTPISGVTVRIPDSPYATRTDARGRFQITGVPAGQYEVRAERLGLESFSNSARVTAGEATAIQFVLADEVLLVPAVVVSATRETQRMSETTASVGVIDTEQLQLARPTHPSDVMDQIPGVWVNTTSGQGHMISIRQPQTTQAVYLFLEDGVPTRSTGFFNHNALYEVNLPQAGRVEVLKGPATALYGSDAIGGVVNVETRDPSIDPSFEAYLEGGAFGYSRAMGSVSDTWGSNGLRMDLNLTRTNGWRDATSYDRQSGTIRWDNFLNRKWALHTILSGSRVHQQTAGASALPLDSYLNDPTTNLTPISKRDVIASRASTAIQYTGDRTLVSITPFVRWNDMEMIPNWSLTYDPTTSDTGHRSLGLLARVRREFEPFQSRLIVGVDVDHSPGGRTEHRIDPTKSASGIFNDYSLGDLIYDYDVTFQGISPFIQGDMNLTEALHLTAGLRYDHMSYTYRSHLAPLASGRWQRPPDADLVYDHLSPKLGAAYDFGTGLNVYANYNHGFRAPSEGQIFRQGTAENTLGLEPVTADSYEIGARGQIADRVGYSLALYHMAVENDILDFTHPDGTPETQNAGATLHEGVEVGLNVRVSDAVRAELSYSYAEHTYDHWSPRPSIDYGGNEMESAPNTIVNGRLWFTPGFFPDSRFGIEWNHLSDYWLDAENEHSYEGHDLFNLHATVPLPHDLELVGRIMNLASTRYAETASYNDFRGEEFAPGLPRTIYLGLQYSWER